MNDDFINEFIKVSVTADKVSVLPDIFAPGVFDLPSVRLSVFIEIDAGQDHRVGGPGIMGFKSFLFVLEEVSAAENISVIKAGGIPDAFLSVAIGA